MKTFSQFLKELVQTPHEKQPFHDVLMKHGFTHMGSGDYEDNTPSKYSHYYEKGKQQVQVHHTDKGEIYALHHHNWEKVGREGFKKFQKYGAEYALKHAYDPHKDAPKFRSPEDLDTQLTNTSDKAFMKSAHIKPNAFVKKGFKDSNFLKSVGIKES